MAVTGEQVVALIEAIAERLDTIDARLDDLAGMLGEAFDQMHTCQECVDDRTPDQCEHRRTTSVDRRHLTLTVEPLPVSGAKGSWLNRR